MQLPNSSPVLPSLVQPKPMASEQPMGQSESAKESYNQQKPHIADDFVLRKEVESWMQKVQKVFSDFIKELEHKHEIDPALLTETLEELDQIELTVPEVLDQSIVEGFKKEATGGGNQKKKPLSAS